MPADPAVSDDEMVDDEDDDVADPDFMPGPLDLDSPGPSAASSSRRTSARHLFEELQEEDTDEEEDVDDPQGEAPPAKKPRKKKKKDTTTWKRVDIENPALPTYQHESPTYVECPSQYFYKFFSPQLIKHITYQTNLYAVQRDVSTTFSTTEEEIMKFVSFSTWG